MTETSFRPAARFAGQRQDVWTIINNAAANSPVQPVVHMGQGFFGYNPPQFVLDAARDALGRVECNQYSPTKGRPRLKQAIASSFSPTLGRELNPETEVVITTGANEGILCAFMAFLEPGDEVIVFEPFFDQYISNIEMPGGKVRYVPMKPPIDGATRTSSAAEWNIDFRELENSISPRTKMIVINTPHNPVGKIFSSAELDRIGELAIKYDLLILSDEVYQSLFYVPFTSIAARSPDLWARTLTVGSAGKAFYATGWRIGYLIGPENLIKYVTAAHMRICYSSVSPLQEAVAVAFEQANQMGFWEKSRNEMKCKIERFCEVFDEMVLNPGGGYFVMGNFTKLRIPDDYSFPESVASRPRDFKLAWFLIQEIGLAAIPPTEFHTDLNAHLAENYLRFAICKNDEVLDMAKDRLRGLRAFMQ